MAHCPKCQNTLEHKERVCRGEVGNCTIEWDECEICGWSNLPPKYKGRI